MNDKIRELQKQINAEEIRIANCNHEFGVSAYNPETTREPYGYTMVAHGSDVWHEPTGYRDVKVDRWTRKCKVCGFEQHTNKMKPVVVGNEPDFN